MPLSGQYDSTPLSGTSYAAPVVSGLAALIRARFPALTARQVIQRIESTAHHPAGGWNSLVGNGTIDALAAVSTGPTPQTSSPAPAELPVSNAPAPGPKDHHARNTALAGAALCLVMVLALWRPSRDRVPRD